MKTRVPPPVLTLLGAALMWALSRWLPLGHWLSGPWNRLGWLVAAAGFAVALIAFVEFWRAETTINPVDPTRATRLVQTGVFAVTRNPMYLGLLLILIGWSIGLGTISPWIVPPIFFWLITILQIMPEEAALERLFGAPYAEYRRRVPRWIG